MGVAAPMEAPDAVAPPPGNRRFPLLDGMRAIAVLCVVVVHATFPGVIAGDPVLGYRFLSHLNIGVTIFFLISGFVLYRPMIAHRVGGPGAPALRDYARRRFLRIVPAYWVLLIVLTLLPGVTAVVGGDWISEFALLHALPVGESGDCLRQNLDCGVAQTWSLVVEATFYAILPFYALAAERITRRQSRRIWMRTELVLLTMLAALSVFVHFWVSDGTMPGWVAGSFIGYVLWFALGMGLAVISVGNEGRDPSPAVRAIGDHPLALWSAAVAAYVVLCFVLPASSFLFARNDQVIGHVGFGAVALLLMLPAVFGDRQGGAPRRALANRQIAWLGLISYGIFLWHYAIALKLGADDGLPFLLLLALTVALSVICATASYYVVERPLLRFKTRMPRGTRRRVEPL